jgi:N-acylglucosamine-6-phosphate 2-epimerase
MSAFVNKGSLIVSQAQADNPMNGSLFMVAMARAARDGGAAGLAAEATGAA